MFGQHQVFLDLKKLAALDGWQRVFLAVHRALAQGQIKLAESNRCGASAPALSHGEEGVHSWHAQLESSHVSRCAHQFLAGGQVALAVVSDVEHAHTALSDQV